MQQGVPPDLPPSGDLITGDAPRTCYRCGTPEPRAEPFRRLPGSQHIIVCPACYQVLWGWKQPREAP